MKANIEFIGKINIFKKKLEIGVEIGWFRENPLKLFSLALFETYEGAGGKIKGIYPIVINIFLFSIEIFVYWE